MNSIPPSESEQPRHPSWSLAHRTVAGLLWMLYGKGAYALLQILVVGILARLVSPTDFGVVSAALIVISQTAIGSSIGLGPALVQRPELEQRHIDTAFTTSVLLGGFLGTVIWLAPRWPRGSFASTASPRCSGPWR